MGNVNAEPINTLVKPKAKCLAEICANFFVSPIQIWLRLIKDVQVPPTCWFTISIFELSPRRTSKTAFPVIRFTLATILSAKQVVLSPRSFGVTCFGWNSWVISWGCCKGFFKPRMIPRSVVWHDVDQHFDSSRMQICN